MENEENMLNGDNNNYDTTNDAEFEEADDFGYDFAADEEENPAKSDEETDENQTLTNQDMNASLDLIDDARTKSAEAKHLKKQKKALRFTAIVFSALLAIVLILYAVCIFTLPTDKAARNVWVGHSYVGGLTYDEILSSIDESYLSEDNQIVITSGENFYTINGETIGLSAIAEDTAKKVVEYGKIGNKFLDGFTAFTLIFKRHYVVPVANVSEEQLREAINTFGNDIYGPLIQHSMEITANGAVITPGKTGYDGNSDTACSEILDALAREQFKNIPVTLASAPPADLTLEQVDAFCYKDPVDAYFTVENNNVKIAEAENGRYINKEEAATLITLVHEGGENVTIPLYVSTPAVTASDLKAKLFETTLSTYTTNYSSSTANRAANIARAASLINGKVVAAGEVFSFNDAVGDRTTANGFFTAKEYVSGQSVDGIGGGTCQVSSTLYSAVLYADMEIVARENHMMSVGYLPLGQDATVAYGSVDFKFKNSSDYPVKITASTGGGSITISIIGTQWSPQKKVEISNSTSTSNNKTYVKTTRTVYQNGSLVKTERMGDSVYAPHPTPEPET